MTKSSSTSVGYLTVAQAAEASGYSMRMLQRLLQQGKIKGIKPGHDWLTRLEAVLEYKAKAKRGRPKSSRVEALTKKGNQDGKDQEAS